MDWVIAVFVVVVLFWAVVELVAIAGAMGAVTGERLARCEHCHRIGLTEEGSMHPGGCPEHLGAHLHHLGRTLAPHVHRPHLPHFSH